MFVSAPSYRTDDHLTLKPWCMYIEQLQCVRRVLRSFTTDVDVEICLPKLPSESGEQEGPVQILAYQRHYECKPERSLRPPIDA